LRSKGLSVRHELSVRIAVGRLERGLNDSNLRCFKLDDAVMAFVATLRAEDPALSVRALLPRIHARFGLDVHPRSLERAVRRAGKKRR